LRRRLVAVVLACALLAPAGALADGDPASDVLLGENVFYPYTPPVSAALQTQLNGVTAAAARARFPIKVALIASPVDLGVIPDLFGKPQKYADFLDQEISFQTKQPLLVVMAAGYGVQGLDAAATAVAPTLAKPAGTQSNALAQAAVSAVSALARAAGHPLAKPAAASGSGSGGSGSGVVIAVVAVVAVGVAGGVVVGRRRRRARAR